MKKLLIPGDDQFPLLKAAVDQGNRLIELCEIEEYREGTFGKNDLGEHLVTLIVSRKVREHTRSIILEVTNESVKFSATQDFLPVFGGVLQLIEPAAEDVPEVKTAAWEIRLALIPMLRWIEDGLPWRCELEAEAPPQLSFVCNHEVPEKKRKLRGGKKFAKVRTGRMLLFQHKVEWIKKEFGDEKWMEAHCEKMNVYTVAKGWPVAPIEELKAADESG